MRVLGLILLSIVLASANSCSDHVKKVVEETYPDGSAKMVRFYKEVPGGREMVKEIDYYSNKNKRMEGDYKAGKRNGKWVYYYENGNIWSEGYFKDGVNEGIRITYYENGHKRYEGKYTMGDRSGVWRFFGEDGRLIREIDYDKEENRQTPGNDSTPDNSGKNIPPGR